MVGPAEVAYSRPPLPVVPEAFDRTIPLTVAEREALATFLPGAPPLRHSQFLREIKQNLARFEQPLWAVAALRSSPREHVAGARRALYAAMLRSDQSFWGWSAAEWLVLCESTPATFVATHGQQVAKGRMTLLDLAYLLGGVSDLRSVGITTRRRRRPRSSSARTDSQPQRNES